MLLATKLLKDRFGGQISQKPDVLTTRNHCCQNQNIPMWCDKYTMIILNLFQRGIYYFCGMEQVVWDPLRKKNVALTPEEKVRQWFIGVLRDQVKVPVHMMMSEVSMKYGRKPFRADILVYGRDTSPLMVVECKREDVTLDREVLEQALKYNMVLGVKFIAITNGQRTFGFRSTGDPEKPFEQVREFPDWETMQE